MRQADAMTTEAILLPRSSASGWPAQNFILSRDIIDATTIEEVHETYREMDEAGLAEPPYRLFDITLPAAVCIKLSPNPRYTQKDILDMERELSTTIAVFRYETVGETLNIESYFKFIDKRFVRVRDVAQFEDVRAVDEGLADVALAYYKLLIVLLATKNIVKTTTERKTVAMGIGAKKGRYRYTTSLSIGVVTEQTDGDHAPGAAKRPHLRRGHVRRQHYGPNNELIKSIFIQPVFVNADPAWISQRQAYNVKAGL